MKTVKDVMSALPVSVTDAKAGRAEIIAAVKVLVPS
jgi:hypothetical protein